jgi:hypothetical protein
MAAADDCPWLFDGLPGPLEDRATAALDWVGSGYGMAKAVWTPTGEPLPGGLA